MLLNPSNGVYKQKKLTKWFHISLQNFVDLAGSERASQAQSVGQRLKEGCHINRSLLTLGTVIRKLRLIDPNTFHFPLLYASYPVVYS